MASLLQVSLPISSCISVVPYARATCLPCHLSYIWRAEHTSNLPIKPCPASFLSLLCQTAGSSSAASSRTFSPFSSLQVKDQVSPLHEIMFVCCVVCCTNTDPNNRYANRETPLNKRTRYDSDQVKLTFRHFPDCFCRISLHQGGCLLRPAAFSATTSPTFEVTYIQCMECVCMYVWSLMIQAFQVVKLYLSVTAVTPSDTTSHPRRAVL